jgi:hypothetical protein|tara:strand:- start:243 stop:473 length:231 start_codon:yes stop_codon:yes gene_type:complete
MAVIPLQTDTDHCLWMAGSILPRHASNFLRTLLRHSDITASSETLGGAGKMIRVMGRNLMAMSETGVIDKFNAKRP